MTFTSHKLDQQTAAAAALIANLKDLLEGDDELLKDVLEGETDIFETVNSAVIRLSELEGFQASIDEHIKALRTRKERFATQAGHLRTALLHAMSVADIKKLELDVATVSRKLIAPSVVVQNEPDIPSQYWKPQAPKLDKKSLLADLKGEKNIPGATLSNGGETIAIRVA